VMPLTDATDEMCFAAGIGMGFGFGPRP
jgi:hypothetical protein